MAELLDAVENLPDLLMRWPDLNESWVLEALRSIEAENPEWRGEFARLLEEDPPE